MSGKSKQTPSAVLTVREACEMASISRSTFYRLLDSTDSGLAGIAVRIPGMDRIRLPREAFMAWLCSRPVSSAASKA